MFVMYQIKYGYPLYYKSYVNDILIKSAANMRPNSQTSKTILQNSFLFVSEDTWNGN
jgi:hypothetical protein